MSLNKSKALRTAEKYALQGKIPAAIDEYRKVVSADPGDLTTVNTLGDLYVRAGRIQDAISNFSRIADSYRDGFAYSDSACGVAHGRVDDGCDIDCR